MFFHGWSNGSSDSERAICNSIRVISAFSQNNCICHMRFWYAVAHIEYP